MFAIVNNLRGYAKITNSTVAAAISCLFRRLETAFVIELDLVSWTNCGIEITPAISELSQIFYAPACMHFHGKSRQKQRKQVYCNSCFNRKTSY